MRFLNATHENHSFVKCQTPCDKGQQSKEPAMFSRFLAHMQMRRSTAFLLARADDLLLDDIGISRADLHAMHDGLHGATPGLPARPVQPLGSALPVAG